MKSFIALAALAPAALAQTYYGCYTEGNGARALSGSSLIDYVTMTVPVCETHCTGLGYTLWGVEYSGECYCGDTLALGSFPSFATDCGMACSGDPLTTCGGPNRLSLYGSSATPPTVTPNPHPAVTTIQPEGCWTELPGPRALAGAGAYSGSAMTTAGCGSYCLNSGFTWFGTEYGSECYCANGLDAASTMALATDCAMACSGAAGEICGGPNRLSVYQWV